MEDRKLMNMIAKRPFTVDDIEDICHVYYFKLNLKKELREYLENKANISNLK